MPTIREHNLSTGEIIDREADPAEIMQPVADDVTNERDHRMSRMTWRGMTFWTDAASLRRIMSAADRAAEAIRLGHGAAGDLRWDDPSNDFMWSDVNGRTVPMDARQMRAFGAAATRWESAHIQAARYVRALSPIPPDFRDGKWWPSEAEHARDSEADNGQGAENGDGQSKSGGVGGVRGQPPVADARITQMDATVQELTAKVAALQAALATLVQEAQRS